MKLLNVAALALIPAACIVSCSDGGGSNTPGGGASSNAGSGVGGSTVPTAGSAALAGNPAVAGMSGAGAPSMAGHGGNALGGNAHGGAGGSSSSGASPGGSSSGGGGGAGGKGGSAGSAGTSGSAGTGGGGGGGGGSTKSAGCGQAAKVMSGTRSIQSNGKTRSFMIRVPESYDMNHPYWLIFGFHWVGGTANDVDSGGTSGYTWSYYGLREQADKSTNAQAIFIAPQGISNGWGNSGNEDVTFTDDMLKLAEDGLCVDTKHVFSTGFSYGGGMTKALGCQRPSVFRAIAVYSGADFLSGGCDATSTAPVAFFGSHSINDGTNAYSSGITILNRFAKNNGCTAQTPPTPTGNTHVCTKFTGCNDGYPVEWCAFNGGGHSPAPVDGDSNGSGGGDKTWTKGEVWKFFTQFQ
jgi:poly(3-hydroxybutyrate) depolymerase